MGSHGIQQYCLRWNNHRANLLLVFEHLFQTESFTDVTLACEGASVKCHKLVLAACSSYFQALFLEHDCRHPIVILKDIKVSEIKAILEYMYKGEVNVAQDQLAGLLKAAESLKVKGLVEDNHDNVVVGGGSGGGSNGNGNNGSSPFASHPHLAPSNVPEFHTNSYSKSNNNSSSSAPTPPHNKYVGDSPIYEPPWANSSSSCPEKNFNLWPSLSKHSLSPSPKSNEISSSAHPKRPRSYENSQNEPVPFKKKYMGINKETPILRTVLGHNALQQHNAKDSPPQSQYHYQNAPPYKSNYLPLATNGPTDDEYNDKFGLEQDSTNLYIDECVQSVDSDKNHEDNSSFSIEEDSKAGIASNVPGQKPEWKRYKQYTKSDIMDAIEAVKSGMSALQAAKKYGVPSRTVYDKVKKMGIATNRHYRKGSLTASPYIKSEDNSNNYVKSEDGSSNFSPPEDHPLDNYGNGADANGLSLVMELNSDTNSHSIKQEDSPLTEVMGTMTGDGGDRDVEGTMLRGNNGIGVSLKVEQINELNTTKVVE